jgi:outer membrane protein assembly factor BamB
MKTTRPLFFFLLFLSTAFLSHAGDWPTYLRDNKRAGTADESLTLPLAPVWSITPSSAPTAAWPGPDQRTIEGHKLRDRNTFDDAFHVAIAGGRVFFGSSVDDQLRCVDLATGDTVWTFLTGGPVRLAPTIHEGKVYFGADDGLVYCLNAADGAPVWTMRPGPADDRLIGRGEMVSRWPVRTGVAIQPDATHGAIAYFGAGIFPNENVYLCAVRASDGRVIWKIDNLSETNAERNDLSPQGYFLTDGDLLVVPSGRSLPAVFDRMTGEWIHKKVHGWRGAAGGVVGGTQALLSDGQIYVWGAEHVLAMDAKTGDVGYGWFAGKQLTVAGAAAYAADGANLHRLNREQYAVNSRERHQLLADIKALEPKAKVAGPDGEKAKADMEAKRARLAAIAGVGVAWKTPSDLASRLVVAGSMVFAGGPDAVAAYDTESGKELWRAAVEGDARGLAIADGRLFVSTDSGAVACFSSETGKAERKIRTGEKLAARDWQLPENAALESGAERILAATGVKSGFCLVLGAEDGRLAVELARRSDLDIHCVEPDAAKAAAARKTLNEFGLYGTRVHVTECAYDALPFPDFFADLVVSDTLVRTGKLPAGLTPGEIARHVKPIGGTICLGPGEPGALRPWLEGTGLSDQATVSERDGFALLVRKALPGAGSWSHQYGEAGNTACSYDYRVKGGLGVLWYGDPGEGKMVNRHDGAVGPLAINGRLIAQGEDRIMAYDAYNGRFLWERENPESIRTGVFGNENPGNLVASDDSLFFMEMERCVELDAATGREKAVHLLPEGLREGEHQWGYVSYRDGILYGTATVRKELDTKLRRRGRKTEDTTDGIFAIDTASGKQLWHYRGRTIEHRTVAVGEGAVYFIDSSVTPEERQAILLQDKAKFAALTPEQQAAAEAELKKQDLRLAVALDSKSGKKLWEKPVDVTDCSEIGIGGGKLTLLYRNNVLLLCGANANGHYWQQFMSGEFSKRRLVALSATDGNKLWAKDANYRHRPIVVDDEIIAEPWSYDLYSGKQKTRQNPLTGEDEPWSIMRSGHHCGMLAATPGLLTFRSGYTGFYDLEQDSGTRHFAGHRTGCWINAIPANGLVSIPESSSGCVCLFSISSTIVMQPRENRQDWAMFSSTGAHTPVKKAAFNLGAPGDRRDGTTGAVWLAYPRPVPERATALDLALDFQPKFGKGGDWVSLKTDTAQIAVDRTADPAAAPDWVYTSWGDGLTSLKLPLLGEKDAPASYRVRLHFAAPRPKEAVLSSASAQAREFFVKLQGQPAGQAIRLTDGDPGVQSIEVKSVAVKDVLTIELESKDPASAPVLNGVEVERE